MKVKGFKRLLAVTVATTMVLSSGIVAFADGDTDSGHATGIGVVEYDDSVAVEYDKVTVDTISDSTAFGFRLDPTGLLSEYEPGEFSDEYSVYFTTTSKGKISVEEGSTLSYLKKVVIADTNGVWKHGSITVTVKNGETPASLTYSTIGEEPLFIWMPDDNTASKAGYSAGLPGKFVELTTPLANVYFEAADETNAAAGFKLKDDYRIETSDKAPIDGKLYHNVQTDIDGDLVDSKVTPLSSYVTITDGAITAVSNLAKHTGSAYANSANDFIYTAPETSKVNYSDTLEVVNKSTKAKTVTATVTLKNVEGLTFKDSDGYVTGTGNDAVYDDKASLWVKIDDGAATSKTLALSDDGKTATATYTATLAAKTGGAEVTYRTKTDNAVTGGHSYARFEGAGAEYSSNSFKIIASANDNEQAKDAWIAWGKTVTASTKPEFDIVYSVTDVADEEEEEEVTPTTAYAAVQNFGGTTGYVLLAKKSESEAFSISALSDVTSYKLKLNSGDYVDAMAKGMVYQGMVGVTYSNAQTLLGFTSLQTGDKITIQLVIGGTTYEAVFTQ